VNDDLSDLDRLGRVDPPEPSVLDAAREVLWSAVAAEMLGTAPPDASHAGGAHAGTAHAGTAHAGTAHADAARADAARADAAHPDAAHAGGEPAAGRNAEEPAREPRRADPGAP